MPAHKVILASSNNTFKKPHIKEGKRKLPEKKEKCNICGRMLLNLTGLNIHKKRMHSIEVRKTNSSSTLSRSNSVKSTTSVESTKSPPPKKLINETHPQDIPLPEDTEDIEIDENTIIEDLIVAKREATDLKIIVENLRNINKTQSQNHKQT